MSDLSENVTGDWINATAFFGRDPSRIRVQMYVEGDNDVMFWQEAVKPYQRKYDISVVTNKSVNPNGGNGKDVLLSMKGLCRNKVIAVDADFDLILDISPNHKRVRSDPFVVNTTWYSVENVLLQNMGCMSVLEGFSEATWDLFLYYLCLMKVKNEIVAKEYRETLQKYNINKKVNSGIFDDFVKSYRKNRGLSQGIEIYKHNSAIYKSVLKQLGCDKKNVWRLTNGHTLWNMVLRPFMIARIRRKKQRTILKCLKSGNLACKSQINNKQVDCLLYNYSGITVPAATRFKLDTMFP